MAGDEMVRQQHRLNRHEFEQTLEDGGEGNGNPLQCSHLGNPTDRRAWQAIVHRTVKSWIRLSGWTTTTLRTMGKNTCGKHLRDKRLGHEHFFPFQFWKS